MTVKMSAADIRYRRREAIQIYRTFYWYRDLEAHNQRIIGEYLLSEHREKIRTGKR